MVEIVKSSQPSSLVAYRQQRGAVYDGANFTPVKNDIRQSLLIEQGYLCAYCMSRIYYDEIASCKPLDPNKRRATKIEHWHCQDTYPSEALDYGNMLIVCCGNEEQLDLDKHCDTKKGDGDLKYNPSKSAHRIGDKIKYSVNGEISSDDTEFNEQLNNVLNLNLIRLKKNRKAKIDSVNGALNKKQGARTRAEIQREIDKWRAADADGYKKEYFGVAVYLLNKKLQRYAQ